MKCYFWPVSMALHFSSDIFETNIHENPYRWSVDCKSSSILMVSNRFHGPWMLPIDAVVLDCSMGILWKWGITFRLDTFVEGSTRIAHFYWTRFLLMERHINRLRIFELTIWYHTKRRHFSLKRAILIRKNGYSNYFREKPKQTLCVLMFWYVVRKKTHSFHAFDWTVKYWLPMR